MQTLRVGFKYEDARVWQGGYNYLLNLCRAIKTHADLEPVVFCGVDAPQEHRTPFLDLLGDDFVQTEAFAPDALAVRRIRCLVTKCDKVTQRVLEENAIDCFFEHADFFGKNFPIPTFSWIGDFQHKHLPKLFSLGQKLKREVRYRVQIGAKRTIMVSSEDAKRDCQQFYSVPDDQIHVVPFAIPYRKPSAAVEQTLEKYDLPEVYFYLPLSLIHI